ncbi:MAG: amino acid permease [Sphingomonadales bacterium]|nr:amino acid permease [Sphingomonadales bacterium]
MTGLMHRKIITPEQEGGQGHLKRTLSWWHLLALGVGAIVGTGIYTLVGIGAGLAGPGVILSFIIAGSICCCAALAYAEVATMIPASGSAYTYSYVVIGESVAWVVGWSLILEYSLVVSAVAVGWSGYAAGFLSSLGLQMPAAILGGPAAGGVVNLPAVLIVFAVAGLLALGTKESATVNAILVVVKIVALLVFVVAAVPAFDLAHFHPFLPNGFASHSVDGTPKGVMAAAAIIFFAFYGFDAISTAAEEAKHPERDLPIGIIGSMIVCTAIYVGVAATAVGSMSYTLYASSAEPLALILRALGHPNAAVLIGAAAVVALPTVILAFLFGQSRIFFVMARDGVLPPALAKVNARTGTPVRITMITAVVVAILAGVTPLAKIAALANAGTLLAFIAVSACMLILRRREPDRKRVFRTPLAWVVGPVAILGCLYLFYSLPHQTQAFFLIWNLFGLICYAGWRAIGSRRTVA